MSSNKKLAKKMVQKTGYQIDPDFNFFTYFDYYMSLKIKGNLKIILLYLVKCHGPDGLINPSQKDMAEKCGMNLTLLKDNLKRLEALGYIKRHRTGRSCYYFVAKPDRPENGLSDRPENRLSDRPENGPALLKENKDKDKDKEKMLPQGIFLKKYGHEIPPGIEGQFRIYQLDSYYSKFGDEFVKICFESKKIKLLERAKYIQGAVKKLENKALMKNEKDNIRQNEQHKQDIVIITERFQKLTSKIGAMPV